MFGFFLKVVDPKGGLGFLLNFNNTTRKSFDFVH